MNHTLSKLYTRSKVTLEARSSSKPAHHTDSQTSCSRFLEFIQEALQNVTNWRQVLPVKTHKPFCHVFDFSLYLRIEFDLTYS